MEKRSLDNHFFQISRQFGTEHESPEFSNEFLDIGLCLQISGFLAKFLWTHDTHDSLLLPS